MPALPNPPLVHRSWLVRGLQSPNPKWAKTGHPILHETVLSFARTAYVKDDTGAFKGSGAAAQYLQVEGHCELQVSSASVVGDPAVGLVHKRTYDIFIDLPADTDLIPRKGDVVSFTDERGKAISLRVAFVDVAEGWADHLEIETEEFE